MSNRMKQKATASASREYQTDSIHRTLDGSIDFRFYRRRAHCLRSGAAWDIINHMSRMLPLFRHHEGEEKALKSERSGCTVI